MKLLLSVLALFSCSTAFSQVKIKINGKDTVINIPLDNGMPSQAPSNAYRMPNALSSLVDNQQLKGNNQQGFDIYQSQVDNMPVLKPDAANLSSLSNSSNFVYKPVQVTAGPNVVRPNNNAKSPQLKKFKLDKLPLSPR